MKRQGLHGTGGYRRRMVLWPNFDETLRLVGRRAPSLAPSEKPLSRVLRHCEARVLGWYRSVSRIAAAVNVNTTANGLFIPGCARALQRPRLFLSSTRTKLHFAGGPPRDTPLVRITWFVCTHLNGHYSVEARNVPLDIVVWLFTQFYVAMKKSNIFQCTKCGCGVEIERVLKICVVTVWVCGTMWYYVVSCVVMWRIVGNL